MGLWSQLPIFPLFLYFYTLFFLLFFFLHQIDDVLKYEYFNIGSRY